MYVCNRSGRWRIVNAIGELVRYLGSAQPIDNGGFDSKEQAMARVWALQGEMSPWSGLQRGQRVNRDV